MNHPKAKGFRGLTSSLKFRLSLSKSLNWFLRLGQYGKPDVAGMPVPPERLASLRRNDQLIVSYPRSGNTWVRNLLRNVFIFQHPELPEPVIWELLPDIHVPEHPLSHPVVHQFHLPSRILKSHNIRDLPHLHLVYILRHPADALVSYYHYHRLQEKTLSVTRPGIDAFCRAMVDGWIEHVEHALRVHQQRPSDTLLVSYEGLCTDPVSELRQITEFLNINVQGDLFAEAVEKSSFARLRSQEESRRGVSEEYFFRKGKSGSAKEELTKETLKFITRRTLGIYECATSTIRLSRDNQQYAGIDTGIPGM